MNIDFDLLYEEYLTYKELYTNKLNCTLFSKSYNISYAKDTSYIYYGKNMFSRSLLRHFNAKKCLIKKLLKKLPRNANPNEYTAFYHDSENKLIFSELRLDDCKRNITVFFDEYVQIECFVTKRPNGEEHFSILSLEICEYDDKNLTKCITFTNKFRSPYGISISVEYYHYDNNQLTLIESYENYNKNFILNNVVKAYCPDRIINPEHFEYSFIKNNDDLLVKKTHYFSKRDTHTEEIIFKKKEIFNLKSNGIECFTFLD